MGIGASVCMCCWPLMMRIGIEIAEAGNSEKRKEPLKYENRDWLFTLGIALLPSYVILVKDIRNSQ